MSEWRRSSGSLEQGDEGSGTEPEWRRGWDVQPTDIEFGVLQALDRYHEWAHQDEVGLEFLVHRVEEMERQPARHRRREELLESVAEESHVSREVAEQAYEIALDEGLEPAFALEIVRAGVAIERPAEQEADAPAVQPTRPEWIEDPPPPEVAHRERVMRETFRRLRGLFEDHPDPKDAFRALARAEDLRRFEYGD